MKPVAAVNVAKGRETGGQDHGWPGPVRLGAGILVAVLLAGFAAWGTAAAQAGAPQAQFSSRAGAETAPGAASAAAVAQRPVAGGSGQLPKLAWAWQSEAEFRWWGLLVYQARLMSEVPITAENFASTPLMLELAYARRFRGQSLAERSLQEMAKMQPMTAAQSARWLQQMLEVLPSVNAGDRITAWHRPGQGIRFYLNDTSVGEIADAEFGRRFLAIWLSDQSPEPAFQQALLGSQP